jgi:DNA-binding LytR/AlgR family response regulator
MEVYKERGLWKNMTLFVAVCDDEKNICSKLESTLMEILDNLNIKYEIDIYSSGEDLYSKMKNGTHYNLIFLDIEFAESTVNGIQVGSLIREEHQNNAVSIVYISWEKKYSMELFDIRPLNFLIKPLNRKKIEQVVRTYLKIAGLWSGDFTYKIGHEIYKVKFKDIVYIESVKRKLVLHLADGKKEEFYGALKEVYHEQLQRFDFLFIHSAYAVNFDYISAVKYSELALCNGKIILPVSQHRRIDVRESYYAITERRRV